MMAYLDRGMVAMTAAARMLHLASGVEENPYRRERLKSAARAVDGMIADGTAWRATPRVNDELVRRFDQEQAALPAFVPEAGSWRKGADDDASDAAIADVLERERRQVARLDRDIADAKRIEARNPKVRDGYIHDPLPVPARSTQLARERDEVIGKAAGERSRLYRTKVTSEATRKDAERQEHLIVALAERGKRSTAGDAVKAARDVVATIEASISARLAKTTDIDSTPHECRCGTPAEPHLDDRRDDTHLPGPKALSALDGALASAIHAEEAAGGTGSDLKDRQVKVRQQVAELEGAEWRKVTDRRTARLNDEAAALKEIADSPRRVALARAKIDARILRDEVDRLKSVIDRKNGRIASLDDNDQVRTCGCGDPATPHMDDLRDDRHMPGPKAAAALARAIADANIAEANVAALEAELQR
jgi:hypothetical protein